MAKALLLSAALALSLAPAAYAQSDAPANSGRSIIRSGNITSTGATVPNPGVSQSGGTTELDRGVQREDNRIENGICKGC